MIEFSLTLPRFRDEDEPQPYRRTFDFCRTVDELGYSGGFIGHHSFSPEVLDESAPFVFLSAIAAHTERMRLGTGVYLAGLHHPANICEQVSTLDRISNGRAVLGVGTGYRGRGRVVRPGARFPPLLLGSRHEGRRDRPRSATYRERG